ncbi:amidohydrolase family protein [Ekhidna sp.]|uniref:amidohydrolase family protein n=1 Tax=Ekhidna sp. TaxID=2608089 RepID=UPI003C7AFAC5
MKIFTSYYLLFLLVSCSPAKKQTYDLIISNVNLIDGTGAPLLERANVYIKDRVITKIDSGDVDGSGEIIDGSGKYLIPGLFDCHVHTTDFNRDFPKLIHYGVTSVFIPGGGTCTNEYYKEMRARGNQDSIPSPRVFHTSQHFTMEGRHPVKTYASSNWVEGETVFFLKDTAQISELVKQVSEYPILGIKITIEDGPAPPFVERMPQAFIDKTVEEGKKYGQEVFAHVSDNEELRMAVEGGVQNLVHYTGVNIDPNDSVHLKWIAQLKDRDASWVTTLMIDKSFLYPLHPEWFEDKYMITSYKKMVEELTPKVIERSNFFSQMLQEEYGIEGGELADFMIPQSRDIQFLLDQGLNMVLGTDTGNDFNFAGYSLHEEMQLLRMGGMEPLQIIKMGTLNAAKMMHAEDSLGSIEVGKLADMILLDQNPLSNIEHTLTINSVFKGGRVQKRMH